MKKTRKKTSSSTHKKKRTHHKKHHVGVGIRRHRRHMRGGNFWDDFKSGFSDGFGFVMNIANQAAPLLKMAAI